MIRLNPKGMLIIQQDARDIGKLPEFSAFAKMNGSFAVAVPSYIATAFGS